MKILVGLHAAFCLWGLVVPEKGREGGIPIAIPTENAGVGDRRDAGEPSRTRTELEQVTVNFSMGKTESQGS